MEHTFLKHAEIGSSFVGKYFIEKVISKTTKTDKLYAEYILRDKSGSVSCKHWKAFEGKNTPLFGDTFAEFNISVEEYNQQPSFIIQDICPCDIPYEDLSCYVKCNENLEEEQKYLETIYNEIEEDTCKEIVKNIFICRMNELSKLPYGVNSVYAYSGGFIKYVYDFVKYVKQNAICFNMSSREMDILITSALLHKIGVLKGYEILGILPKETRKLKLYGLKQLSLRILWHEIDKMYETTESNWLNRDIVSRVIHCVSSYDIENDVKPHTFEAIVMSSLMKVRMDISNIQNFIDEDETKDEFTAINTYTGISYLKRI